MERSKSLSSRYVKAYKFTLIVLMTIFVVFYVIIYGLKGGFLGILIGYWISTFYDFLLVP